MSLNDITDSFGQYAKGNSKQCVHLKELLRQAIIQLEEEQEVPIIVKEKNKKFPFQVIRLN